ncbi:unnamed protein product [Bubo scandiacus]
MNSKREVVLAVWLSGGEQRLRDSDRDTDIRMDLRPVVCGEGNCSSHQKGKQCHTRPKLAKSLCGCGIFSACASSREADVVQERGSFEVKLHHKMSSSVLTDVEFMDRPGSE